MPSNQAWRRCEYSGLGASTASASIVAMDAKWWILAVVVVLSVIVVFVAGVAYARHAVYRAEQCRRLYARKLYSGLRPGLRTGDLLLFDSSSFSLAIKWTTLSPYSHAGVVLVIDGKPYIAEINLPTTAFVRKPGTQNVPGDVPLPENAFVYMPRGVAVLPLDSRLRDYPGRVFVARLDRPLSAAQEEKITRAAFDDNRQFASLFDQVVGGGAGLWRPRSLHCCQHVSRMLNAAGAHRMGGPDLQNKEPLPETALIGSMRAIAKPGEIRFAGGARYEPPVEILYDLDAE